MSPHPAPLGQPAAPAAPPRPPVDRSGCPARYHGDRNAYNNAGCRCPDAAADKRRYDKRRRAGLHQPRLIDATGTRRRLQALAAIGWPLNELSTRLGHTDRRAAGRLRAARQVRISSAAKVAALYEQLAMTPGPATKARGWARKVGWAPPLAWDEATIDDPTATPDHGPARAPARSRVDVDRVAVELACAGHLHQLSRPLSIAERLQAVRWLADHGHPDTEIAARVGVSIRTVQRLRAAHHIPAALPPAPRPHRSGAAA